MSIYPGSGLDYTKFNALTLVKVPNTNKLGYWEAALGKITVNGVDTGIASRTGIMDTGICDLARLCSYTQVWIGTSLLQVSPADAQIIHNLIKGTKPDGHGGFTVPCTLQDKLALTIGGQAFSIDPRDLAVTPVNANDPQGDCTSGVSSSTGIPANTWVVSCHELMFRTYWDFVLSRLVMCFWKTYISPPMLRTTLWALQSSFEGLL